MYAIWVYTFEGIKAPIRQLFEDEGIAYQALQELMTLPNRPRFGWVQKVEVENGISG